MASSELVRSLADMGIDERGVDELLCDILLDLSRIWGNVLSGIVRDTAAGKEGRVGIEGFWKGRNRRAV